MLAEWSAECTADDPILVVPWSDPSDPSGMRFVDLRENPYDLDHLPEAERNPPLMQALRSLNAPRSLLFTAKCDAWSLDSDELEALILNLDPDLDGHPDNPTGFASYIDLLWRDRQIFISFHQQQQLLDRLTRRAAALDHPEAALDFVLRPALIDLTGPQEGFAISLYVKAIGPDLDTAWHRWAAALDDVVSLLRSKDLLLA
ncbi:hypothetical protein [Granulicella arctica]|uniref:Uncharacterized protein n=1 Tax=Granulicella arctica TaxID=940613 RepID=A0A7Y9TFZ7_9BACT|nr:hypothetical protein [Granulicella arctica]NYF78175.1 hypothetical protein [Granulicella arctica]